jgi:inner membrane protein
MVEGPDAAVPVVTRSRSMGLKLVMVCGLALLMGIPAIFVAALVNERAQRAAEVTAEIARHVGGSQVLLGPTLVIPYTVTSRNAAEAVKHSIYLVFPAQASAVLALATEERHRSLFRVPVYRANLNFDAVFDLSEAPRSAPLGAQLDWSQAGMLLGISDPHGVLADSTLTVGRTTLTLVPAEIGGTLPLENLDNQNAKLALFSARLGGLIESGTSFRATSTLQFSGAERISVLAYGKATQLTATGDWRNPGFDGGILPVTRNVTPHGFTAKWSVPFIARGVRAEGPIEAITGLSATALGLSFVEVADPYQSVDRSLKYALLFLGLIFLAYFVFEVTTRKRVHPAQYILVGIAQIIFYLLLLSLSERIGFDRSFLLAGAATVTLLSTNAAWVFSSRAHGLTAFLIFSVLYSLTYLLLRLEDNALLVGAITSFLAVAIAMYLTRGIDWYSAGHPAAAQDPAPPSASTSAP